MKKSERDALKNAFNIPEPQKKEIFIAEYNALIKKNERRLRFPIYIKYASTAVFAALIIGVWSHMSLSSDFNDKFNNGDITVETTTTTSEPSMAPTESEENIPLTTAVTSVKGNSEQKQTSTTVKQPQNTESNPDNDNKNEHMTDEEHHSDNEFEYDEPTPHETSVSRQTSSAEQRTTAVNTIATVTSRKTTSSESNEFEVLTTVSQTINLPYTTKLTTFYLDSPPATGFPVVDICPSTTTPDDNSVPKPLDTAPPFEPAAEPWVIPSVRYEKNDNTIDISDFWGGTSFDPPISDDDNTHVGASGNDIKKFLMDIADSSSCIIKAHVHNIIYTTANNLPYTQVDIEASIIYKNDEPDKGFISLYIPGGYMLADDFCEMNNIENLYPEGAYVSYCLENIEKIKEDEEYIFFISKGSSFMPYGAHNVTTLSNVGIFEYDGGKYVSLGNPNLSFTLKELYYLT